MSEENLIPYDRMKEQLERDITAFLDTARALKNCEIPRISFEKGSTQISFQIPGLTEAMLFDFIGIFKKHIENIRVLSFDAGHYAFQALNKNVYKSENIQDNIRLEILSIVTPKVEISKKGNLSQEEINIVSEIYKRAYSSVKEDPEARLRKLGASVLSGVESPGWDYIAGYEEVKRKIRETVILPLKNPDVYDAIAKLTRNRFESNRPRAVLFEGPPGVGKTTAARIISGEASMPLVYVPIESIMSKWYGQSSQNLSQIFDACEDMGGAIIFLDEIDSLAGSRDSNMFEATRRILSVLLRKLDGIEAAENTLTIGATNRKGDLDHALLSRFDQMINFPLPAAPERASIFSGYAKHLTPEECSLLGQRSEGLSGRSIKDICEFAERRWARKIVIKKLDVSPPPVEYYRHSIKQWGAGV